MQAEKCWLKHQIQADLAAVRGTIRRDRPFGIRELSSIPALAFSSLRLPSSSPGYENVAAFCNNLSCNFDEAKAWTMPCGRIHSGCTPFDCCAPDVLPACVQAPTPPISICFGIRTWMPLPSQTPVRSHRMIR